MPKRYVLKLTVSEREELEKVVRTGKAAGWKIQRAQALLKCDQGVHGPGWTDEQVADAFGCTTRSLQSWRQQALEDGPLSLLERQFHLSEHGTSPRTADPARIRRPGPSPSRACHCL